MEIKTWIDRMVEYEGSKIRAIASANIGGLFAVHGLRVIGSEKGLFVQMPQTSYEKDGRRQYSDVFHPITADARQKLYGQVLAAYEQKLHMGETESQAPSPAMAQEM